jgi:hypothetical protein
MHVWKVIVSPMTEKLKKFSTRQGNNYKAFALALDKIFISVFFSIINFPSVQSFTFRIFIL